MAYSQRYIKYIVIIKNILDYYIRMCTEYIKTGAAWYIKYILNTENNNLSIKYQKNNKYIYTHTHILFIIYIIFNNINYIMTYLYW